MNALRAVAALSMLFVACGHPAGSGDGGSSDGSTGGGGAGGGSGASCTPTDGGPDDAFLYAGYDADAGLPLGAFMGVFSAAYCDGWRRCAPFAPYLARQCQQALQQGTGWTLWSCDDHPGGEDCLGTGSYQGQYFAAFAVSAAAGRLTYHEDQAIACVTAPFTACESIDGQEAHEPAQMPPACDAVFTGAITDGGACTHNLECLGGACSEPVDSCDGTCVPYDAGQDDFHGPGASCAYDAGGCDAGFSCDGVLCRSSGAAGDACETMLDCAPSLYCQSPTPEHEGRCELQLSGGAPCTHDSTNLSFNGQECPGLESCVGLGMLADGGVRSGTCRALSGFGGPCGVLGVDDTGTTNLISGCLIGLSCSCGVCMIPPSVGAECSAGPEACNPTTSYCDVASSTCQALKLTDPCTAANQCLSSSCTDQVCDVQQLLDACF